MAAYLYSRLRTPAPHDAEVLNNLARTLVGAGEEVEAAALYNRAIAAGPTLPAPRLGLSWIRATSAEAALRDAAEALRLAREAVRLGGDDHPDALDTLAAAYAAAGRFDEAVATARRAAARARATPGLERLAPPIEGRLRMYLRFEPYRAPR